jgi:pre-mRNA-processing factor 19
VYNRETGKIVDTLKGHSKRLTDVKFHPSEKLVFTTSADATAMIWKEDKSGKYGLEHTLKDHQGEVVGCTLHPSGQYLITGSMDKTWCFYDIATGQLRQKVADEKVTEGYTRVAFHPDGMLLGSGTVDSVVRIFDVQKQKNVANFMGHSGRVTALSFSENGFFLASGDEKGVVKLWDLRKLQNFHTIPFKSAEPIASLEFDLSGSYLAVTGADISIYTSKQWETVKTWNDHSKEVTALKFGNNADWFATTSKDRSLKIFTETD